jgi:hypothetical protein
MTEPRKTGAPMDEVSAMAEALHDAMCDVSHHDRSPARCSHWAKYPHLAASVLPRFKRRLEA